MVNENSLPEKLKQNPQITCVVGLSTEPERLADLRKNRMNSLKETETINYTNLENIKKIIFKMNKVNENGYRVFFTAVASNVLDSFKNETRILLEGKISDLSTNLNGNIQLNVSNVENNDNLFSTPLVIKNGIISVLFIPLIDLKELFSF